ncbi:HNH endonuclease signature motif containing protein [Haemophilus seminalis]|jgi:putative CRISPR-associated protein, csn1 family|nr:HNH endonuclease signature motif containing protein [Haemophilus seminalis]MDK7280479.1 HNH endonuclease signature motif containing protein [Haemophilus seminalis]
MKSDYRNTIYEVSKKNIINEKNALEDKIKKEHPKVKIIYNQINKKDGNYNKQFRNIYNNKCAYCGISTDVISSELFEIDHFICEISFNGDSINAGKINNLVLSCKKCNRAKKDFIWNEIYSLKFNVDDESITELFYRDVDYSIKIEKEYITDNSIYNFYIKLKLNEEIRRLDFLLMNMYGFYNKYYEDKNIYRILEYIVLLQKKRNEL